MNDENLIPFSKRTESEHREISRKGGKASGVARRKKRRMRELFETAMLLPASEEDKAYYNQVFNATEEEVDNEMTFVASVFDGAKQGNDSDKRIVLRMLGEDDELNEKIRSNKAHEKLERERLDAMKGVSNEEAGSQKFADILQQLSERKSDLLEHENKGE